MRFQLDTPLPVAAAFDRVADFGRLDEWDPTVAGVEVEGPPLQAGTVYHLRTGRLFRGVELRYELISVDPPHLVQYRGGTASVASTDTISVRPIAGGSRVTVDSHPEVSGRPRWIGPLVRLMAWVSGRFLSLPSLRRQLSAESLLSKVNSGR